MSEFRDFAAARLEDLRRYRQNNTAVMVAATGVVPDFTTQQLLAAAKLPSWEL